MTPRRREIDWLAVLGERPGSEQEARSIEKDARLALRADAMRKMVEDLQRYRRACPVTADDMIEAAEGRAGSVVLARIESDPELTRLVAVLRSAARGEGDESRGELPLLPAAVRERLAARTSGDAASGRASARGTTTTRAESKVPSVRDRLAKTLEALGRSAKEAARRAAEIMSFPEAVAVPAASDDLTRAQVSGAVASARAPGQVEGRNARSPKPRRRSTTKGRKAEPLTSRESGGSGTKAAAKATAKPATTRAKAKARPATKVKAKLTSTKAKASATKSRQPAAEATASATKVKAKPSKTKAKQSAAKAPARKSKQPATNAKPPARKARQPVTKARRPKKARDE